ncbi:MAG: hypothetical protein JSU63_14510 [Phycisphaerales bacterium]|nr:MAG: hypothetical protein JSU63_14510 [Phycisphaerales bacterium]
MPRRYYRTSPSRCIPSRFHTRTVSVSTAIVLALWGSANREEALAADGLHKRQASHNDLSRVKVICAQFPAGSMGAGSQEHTLVGLEDPIPLSSRIVSFSPQPASDADALSELTSGFVAAGRPDLSFDATRVLFVGRRKATDLIDVWEMNVDGTGLRKVTDHAGDCVEAIYLSTIYTIDAKGPSRLIAYCSRDPNTGRGALYTCRADGTDNRQITYNPYGVFSPYMLSDSRLLYSTWSRTDGTAKERRSADDVALYTVHIDGADVFPFSGVHESPAVRSMPCETTDGWITYVESDMGALDPGGALFAVKRTRSLRTRRLVADASSGRYYSPSPLPDGRLLASYKPAGSGSYGVYVLEAKDPQTKRKLLDTPEWHEIDAVAVLPRLEPAGRSSVVDLRTETAELYCLDAYMSDTAAGKQIERGQIGKLRVIQALTGVDVNGGTVSGAPITSKESTPRTVAEIVLGEVPVERDGSFYLRVPASTPLRLETLDQRGRVLQAMKNWIWVMPDGQRGCIGCHEDRELTPPNRHVLALRKRPRMVGVTGGAERAYWQKRKSAGEARE